MSATNHTTNYNLPQFVGTDKPTWLTDVNNAMSAIDTQMKSNADSATSANTSATTANNAIGTLANLETTAKTDLVSAVNEVNTNLGTTSGVASQASADATNALNKATALEGAFNLNTFEEFTGNTISKTNTNVNYGTLRCACNSDGSVGKIYGFLGGVKNTNSASSTENSKILIHTSLRPTTPIVIADFVIGMQTDGTINGESFRREALRIETNGDVWFANDGYWYNRTFNFYFPPCLLFMKDFGDTPSENA